MAATASIELTHSYSDATWFATVTYRGKQLHVESAREDSPEHGEIRHAIERAERWALANGFTGTKLLNR